MSNNTQSLHMKRIIGQIRLVEQHSYKGSHISLFKELVLQDNSTKASKSSSQRGHSFGLDNRAEPNTLKKELG